MSEHANKREAVERAEYLASKSTTKSYIKPVAITSVVLTPDEAEVVVQALSARATDEMRYRAWAVLDAKIKEAKQL